MEKNKTKRVKDADSDSLENLLFSGLLYRIISEPDDLRKSMLDMCTFLDTSTALNIDEKIQKIDSAMQTVDRIKDRDGAFTAFETLLQGSRYSLIIADCNYEHIFHNDKCAAILDKLMGDNGSNTLKSEIIIKINKAKCEYRGRSEKLINIPNLVDNLTNAYLISNTSSLNDDRELNILLIPDANNPLFELQMALVEKFKLTNKEQLVLTNLINGCDVNQISEQFCISLNTVRSHLKSIFRKTKTKSQSDLIRLFLNHESQLIDSYFESGIATRKLGEVEDQYITLSAGNKICYRDYGPKDGRPIVIFHNLYGSRYHIPHNYSDILSRTNRRIIIPERPGYGRSDPIKNYNEIWGDMLNEIIGVLGIDRFDVLGNVSGTALAIRYAAKHPEMIDSVIFTSPLFINTAEQKNLLGELPYAASRMVSASKRLAGKAYQLWMKSMKFDSEGYIRKMIKEYAGSAEMHVLDDQDYIDRLVINFKESQRNNSHGSGQDAVFSLLPPGLDLANIKLPFSIWVGDEDSLVSVSSVQTIYAPLPNKTFHVRKGYGEDIFYHSFEEIIR